MRRRPQSQCLLLCQRPLTRLLSHTIPAPPLIRSLGYNKIGDRSACALATILKETKITQLRCAAAPQSVFPPMAACLRQ